MARRLEISAKKVGVVAVWLGLVKVFFKQKNELSFMDTQRYPPLKRTAKTHEKRLPKREG